MKQLCRAILLAFFCGACALARAQTPLRIVLLVDEIKAIRNVPLVVAERLGYLDTAAVKVTVMNVRDDIAHADMLADGRVDAVMAYYHHNLVNAAAGRPTQAVVTLGVTPGAQVLVSQQARSRYQTLADLEGSRFIAGGAGSSKTTVANYLLLEGGHAITDYTRLPTDGKDRNLAALREGSADFVVAPVPEGDAYVTAGVATVFADLTTPEGTMKHFGALFPSSTVFMSAARLQAHPEIAQHLAAAFVKTLHYLHTHSAEEIAALVPVEVSGKDRAAYLKVLRQELPMFAGDGRMPVDGAAKEWRVLAAANDKLRGVDVEQTYTNAFVDAALAMAPAAATAPAATGGPAYRLERVVTLDSSDTGWDYQALDAARGRLYIGHRKDGLQVYDTVAGRLIGTVAQSTGANNAALAPEFDLGIAGTTDGQVLLFRPSTGATLSRTPSRTSGFDGATYDAVTRRFAMVGEADAATHSTPMLIFDGRSGAPLGSVDLASEKVDAPRPDGRGHVLMPLRDRNAVLKVDMQQLKVVARYPLHDCATPAALETDIEHQRVFVGCRGDAASSPALAVLDAVSGRQLGRWRIGRGVDEVMHDKLRGLVITANGEDGTLSLIRQRTADDYRPEETVSTRPMARTGVLDAGSGRIYLVTAAYGIRDVRGSSETHFLPDSFSVLTYGRQDRSQDLPAAAPN